MPALTISSNTLNGPFLCMSYVYMRDVILVSAIDFRFGVKYRHTLCSNMFYVVRRQFDFVGLNIYVFGLFFGILTKCVAHLITIKRMTPAYHCLCQIN